MKTCICILALVSVLAVDVYAQQVNPCIICPNGVTAGYDDAAPYATFGNNMTCAQAIDAAKLYETGSRDCASSEAYEIACCFTVPENPAMNPCIICPDGITEGYDAYAPWAVIGDPTTCAELIDAAKLHEAGSEDCALAEGDESSCCLTEIENPCIICPNGATVGDDYVPPGYEDYELTCADFIDVATLYETESSWCAVNREEYESLCCPPVSSAPTPMPVNDTTVATPMTSSTNVTPSPVEPLTTSPSSNVGTTTLLWVGVISAVAGVVSWGR